MKRIILFVLVIWGINTHAQTTKDSLGMPTFDMKTVGIQEVVKLDSTTQKELYSRAKLFFAESFKSAKKVIQLDDGSSIIVGKGITTFTSGKGLTKANIDISFLLKIELKEGQYRYTISNIVTTGYAIPIEQYWKKLYGPYRPAVNIALRDIEKMVVDAMSKKGW